MDIREINRLLAGVYGVRTWQPHHDPISELIAVILSQNTSDTNSSRAFNGLVGTFGNWNQVANANVEDIERAIQSGGLSRIKAARIKQILQLILQERGNLDLSFLEMLPITEAGTWLKKFPGVGPKTVSCVLLFSLGKPVFPVDTHVFRVAKRLGLIENGLSVEKAHEILGDMVPAVDVYQLHMNMVEHGRQVCKAHKPKCAECVLNKGCPSRFPEN